MDQQQLQQKIAEYYAKLPADVQSVFASMSWLETLKTISKKYNLTEPQIATLATETTLAFLGIVHMNEYEEMLLKELVLPKEIVDPMISEIDTLIFKAIRPQLEGAYDLNANAQVENSGPIVLDPKFSALPIELQNALARSDYQKKLYEIGTKYKLQVNKMAVLEEVTVKFITGAISPSQYESELSLGTELEAMKVKDIATDVNETILKGIRAFMQNPAQKVVAQAIAEDVVPIPPYAKKVEAVTKALETIQKPAMKESIISDVIQPIQTTKQVSESESGIYQEAGIEMVIDDETFEKEDEKDTTLKEDSILSESGIDMIQIKTEAPQEHILPNAETAKAALEGIEHPQDVATSIIGDKLGGVTMSKSTTSNYSLPKINSVADQKLTPPTSKAPDPYHEPI